MDNQLARKSENRHVAFNIRNLSRRRATVGGGQPDMAFAIGIDSGKDHTPSVERDVIRDDGEARQKGFAVARLKLCHPQFARAEKRRRAAL